MLPELTLTLHLILLHSVEGHEITVAAQHVTSLRAARPNKANELFTENVNCLVGLADGRYITVIESCNTVRELLEK